MGLCYYPLMSRILLPVFATLLLTDFFEEDEMLVGMHSLWRMNFTLFHIPTFNGNCRAF